MHACIEFIAYTSLYVLCGSVYSLVNDSYMISADLYLLQCSAKMEVLLCLLLY